MAGMNFTMTGSDQMLRKLNALGPALAGPVMETALAVACLEFVNDAKTRAPYKTGNLRRSLHVGGHRELTPDAYAVQNTRGQLPAGSHTLTTATVYFGTNVEYGKRIEYGFVGADSRGRIYHQAARPYLRPAIDTQKPAAQRVLGQAARQLLARFGHY